MKNVTKQQIDILVKLQDSEIESSRIQLFLNEMPKKLDILDGRLKEFEQSIQKGETAINELKNTYKENESDVQANLDRISKSNEKLASVKTNKEYQAQLKEVEAIKKTNSKLEDEMLEILDGIEENEKMISQQKEEYSQEKEQIDHEKDELKGEYDKEKEKLDLLNSDCHKLSEQVDPELLERYNKIREQSTDTAIAGIKDEVCQGCHMNIPPQRYNELRGCETVEFCPHCQRIIYYNGNNA